MSRNKWNALSESMADAVDKASVSTVMVNARRRIPASGIVIKEDYILTANHVIEVDEDIKVVMPDGEEVNAELIGSDPGSDLALLKLEKPCGIPIKHNGETRVGQMVLALGRPTTNGIQASLGIISAFGGPVRTRRGSVLEQHIRTDAIPYPGFSGGPLIDVDGKVIGMNTSGFGHGSSITIPIKLAQKIADELEVHGSVKRGYLGVQTQNVPLPEKAELDHKQGYGLLIIEVKKESPAEEGGLMTGDIIVRFNEKTIENHDALFAAMTGSIVGNPASVEVLRGGKQEKTEVTLRERKRSKRRSHRKKVFHGHDFQHKENRSSRSRHAHMDHCPGKEKDD